MRNPSLRALLLAEVVSSTGSAMTFVALPWFVLVTTGSATRVSLVLDGVVVQVTAGYALDTDSVLKLVSAAIAPQ